jgi:hypothetical protein
MRPSRIAPLLGVLALALLGTIGRADETMDPELMDRLAETVRSLDARLAARDAAAAAQDARALEVAFDALVTSYSKRDDGRDAVVWSSLGKDLSSGILPLLAAHDLDRAQQAAASLRAACAGCHRAYR